MAGPLPPPWFLYLWTLTSSMVSLFSLYSGLCVSVRVKRTVYVCVCALQVYTSLPSPPLSALFCKPYFIYLHFDSEPRVNQNYGRFNVKTLCNPRTSLTYANEEANNDDTAATISTTLPATTLSGACTNVIVILFLFEFFFIFQVSIDICYLSRNHKKKKNLVLVKPQFQGGF